MHFDRVIKCFKLNNNTAGDFFVMTSNLEVMNKI